MAKDILMWADPSKYQVQKSAFPTLFLPIHDFWQNEPLVKQYDEALWQNFHTHGKYARILQHAEYIALAIDKQKNYVGSALIVPVGAKWLLEYVMTNPNQQGKGIGSAVMDKTLREAKKAKVQWVILNCDPEKNQGQLPTFYSKFGFHQVTM